MGKHGFKEQRAHERHHVKEGAFVVIKKQHDTKLTVGQIIDISNGGLSLKYLAESEQIKGNHKLDVYFSGCGLQIKDVSFKTIRDFGLESSFPFSSIVVRRGCIQFQHLEHEHKNQLDNFIQTYTNAGKN